MKVFEIYLSIYSQFSSQLWINLEAEKLWQFVLFILLYHSEASHTEWGVREK